MHMPDLRRNTENTIRCCSYRVLKEKVTQSQLLLSSPLEMHILSTPGNEVVVLARSAWALVIKFRTPQIKVRQSSVSALAPIIFELKSLCNRFKTVTREEHIWGIY
jgi:hypothetical protein